MLGRNKEPGLIQAPAPFQPGPIQMNLKKILLFTPLFAALAICLPSLASPPPAVPGQPLQLAAKSGELSLDQATAKVRKETGGRVLSARAETNGGRTSYRIKVLLPSGHVRIVRVDAATGAMD
jgi:hypothetical protein